MCRLVIFYSPKQKAPPPMCDNKMWFGFDSSIFRLAFSPSKPQIAYGPTEHDSLIFVRLWQNTDYIYTCAISGFDASHTPSDVFWLI